MTTFILYYLEDVLVFSVVTEGVLAPARGPAAMSSVLRVRLGQTGRTDVRRLLEVHGVVQAQQGDVIEQRPRVELRVNVESRDISLNVGVELYIMVHIPLSQPHTEVKVGVTVAFEGFNYV